MRGRFTLLLLFLIQTLIAQTGQPTADEPQKKRAEALTYQAYQAYQKKKQVQAEADYRRAISTDKQNVVAPYNLGDLLYHEQKYNQAQYFYGEASLSKEATKAQKHKAFHNLGNTFMKEKQYDKAVQAYKEALRNNPADDETRYNFALAKELLRQNPPQNQQNNQQDNKDNSQDNKDDPQDKKDDPQDKKDDSQDKKDDSQDKKDDPQDKKDDPQDNKDNSQDNKDNSQDKKDDPQDNKDNSQDKKDDPQDKKDDAKDGKAPHPNAEGKPEKMSPTQAERILEAMNAEEKKTQEKVNGRKVKVRPVRSGKDW